MKKHSLTVVTSQKMKFSIKDFFSKCDHVTKSAVCCETAVLKTIPFYKANPSPPARQKKMFVYG